MKVGGRDLERSFLGLESLVARASVLRIAFAIAGSILLLFLNGPFTFFGLVRFGLDFPIVVLAFVFSAKAHLCASVSATFQLELLVVGL